MKSENLAFDGMAGDGVNRAANKYAGNQSGLTAKARYSAGPRKGNASDCGNEHGIGPSATRDKPAMTIATAAQGGKINGGASAKSPSNPDKIYIGK